MIRWNAIFNNDLNIKIVLIIHNDKHNNLKFI